MVTAPRHSWSGREMPGETLPLPSGFGIKDGIVRIPRERSAF